MLRDAQVQNSAGYRGFQGEINHLTGELLQWERNIGQINRLEATIASVDSAAQANEHNALYIAGHWSRLAVGCGFIGALLLLLSFKWSLSPLLLWAGAALLALASGAAFMSARTYRSAWEERDRANRQLAQLRATRNALIPAPHPPIDPYPRVSYVVVRDLS
ncbi:MAG TPA: hypothetical protein VJ757_02620 [Pseudonocardiaceae bacterium]|nr:hypothetical protein [Pseudonocardiaceae bacterium]